MKKPAKQPSGDITAEHYKGPSVASAIAGEGFIAHIAMGLSGLLVGGLAALAMPRQALKIEESISQFHLNNNKSTNWLVKAPAEVAGFMLKGINYITEHTPTRAKNWLENKIGHQDRFRATVFGGSTLGAFGYFVFPLLLGPKGARKGIEGRQQFERAKEEIITLRTQLEEKNTELDATKSALEDMKTANAVKKGLVKMSVDEAPATEESAAAASHADKLGTKPEASWASNIATQKTAQAEAEHTL